MRAFPRGLREKIVPMLQPVLESRFVDESCTPSVELFCPGYELGSWREDALVGDVFDRHLTSFALNFSEFGGIDGELAAGAIRRAAKAVYATDKYKLRGEFGELLMHAVLRDFYGAEPAVSKIFYKDSANDVVKGFDGVHLVATDEAAELWLGEAKFYSDSTAAVADALASLQAHVAADFLRAEFIAITNKLDPAWPQADSVRAMLASARSLDEIVKSLVIPVFLTYESKGVQSSTAVDEQYMSLLADEARAIQAKFVGGMQLPINVRIVMILLPLASKLSLVTKLDAKLKHWQAI